MKQFLIEAAGLIDPNQVGVPVLTGDQVLQNGLNVAYFVAGIIAVVVIIVGGIMYATSAGDQANVTKARQLILYSVVGLVVILSAWAITNFVIGRFS
jgi:type IV secretory pathway VirB2 component (pilin)